MSTETENELARIEKLEQKVEQLNKLILSSGSLLSGTIDGLAEFGALIPLGEIIVTIGAFYGAGLGELYGVHVLMGLVFAQVAALYLTSHYRDTAMHEVGETAIFTSIIIGAINTGIAVYLALSAESGSTLPAWLRFIPAFSSGGAVLLMYVAKYFTHERVSTRKQLKQQASNELKEMERVATAERNRANTLAKMQQTRLNMEASALERMAKNPQILEVQERAMWMTVVHEIMATYGINQRTKLGKQLIALADESLSEQDLKDAIDELDFLADQPQPEPNQNGRGG